ncbi:MAG: hypothetical protein PWP53_4418, partial [Lacrimispora sp.]|nr:hypothetical protein [Lacrimispora sp.]
KIYMYSSPAIIRWIILNVLIAKLHTKDNIELSSTEVRHKQPGL